MNKPRRRRLILGRVAYPTPSPSARAPVRRASCLIASGKRPASHKVNLIVPGTPGLDRRTDRQTPAAAFARPRSFPLQDLTRMPFASCILLHSVCWAQSHLAPSPRARPAPLFLCVADARQASTIGPARGVLWPDWLIAGAGARACRCHQRSCTASKGFFHQLAQRTGAERKGQLSGCGSRVAFLLGSCSTPENINVLSVGYQRRARGHTATLEDSSLQICHCLIVASPRITAVSGLARSDP